MGDYPGGKPIEDVIRDVGFDPKLEPKEGTTMLKDLKEFVENNALPPVQIEVGQVVEVKEES